MGFSPRGNGEQELTLVLFSVPGSPPAGDVHAERLSLGG